MMSIEEIILSISYLGILMLMTSNGFWAFPSSQLIYIVAGYFAFTGDLNLLWIILIGALGHSLGNWILYEAARKKGLKYSVKFIKFLFQFSDAEKEVKKFQIVFNKRSKLLLFVGKLANPSKIFIPIPAGIAKMNRLIYLVITYITSVIWACVFTFIGYYFGKSYDNFGFIGAGLLVVFLIFASYFYKLMNSEEVIKELEKKNSEEDKNVSGKDESKTKNNYKKENKKIELKTKVKNNDENKKNKIIKKNKNINKSKKKKTSSEK